MIEALEALASAYVDAMNAGTAIPGRSNALAGTAKGKSHDAAEKVCLLIGANAAV
jgi:hypothetical protein